MFGKKTKKKSMVNIPTLDLRPYTADALSEIEEIANVALLILPKEMDEKFIESFSKIELTNVASTIKLDDNLDVHTINGSNVIDTINEPGMHLINGIGIIKNIEPNKDIQLMLNGIVIFDNSCRGKVNLFLCNGTTNYADLSGGINLHQNETLINAKTLDYINDGMFFVAGNKIIIEEDVTSDMLAKKNVQLVAGNKIVCGDDAMAYVRATAIVGNKIQSLKEYNKLSEKDKDIK